MSILDEVRKMSGIIDQNSYTAEELAKEGNFGISTMRAKIHEKVESGEWERVAKIVKGKRIPSYRLAKTTK